MGLYTLFRWGFCAISQLAGALCRDDYFCFPFPIDDDVVGLVGISLKHFKVKRYLLEDALPVYHSAARGASVAVICSRISEMSLADVPVLDGFAEEVQLFRREVWSTFVYMEANHLCGQFSIVFVCSAVWGALALLGATVGLFRLIVLGRFFAITGLLTVSLLILYVLLGFARCFASDGFSFASFVTARSFRAVFSACNLFWIR